MINHLKTTLPEQVTDVAAAASAPTVTHPPSDRTDDRTAVPHRGTARSIFGALRELKVEMMRRLHHPVYERRIATLCDLIVPHLQPGDRVLDVGCGGGALGRALLERCQGEIEMRGLEPVPRGGEGFEVDVYDGNEMPYEPGSFDVVILADVLHHERDPDRLLDQCIQATRRLLIVKDHQRAGWLAQSRISLLDWAANVPYGVECFYRYQRPEEWEQTWRERPALDVVDQRGNLNLYPPGYNFIFGRRLQYFAALRTRVSEMADPSGQGQEPSA